MGNGYIYIACPASIATGGTEAAHALCAELVKYGRNAVMYYYCNVKAGVSPVPERFKRFDISYVTKIDDNSDSVLILPEVKTEFLRRFSKVRKCIWWLSVDKYTIPWRFDGIKQSLKTLLGRFNKRFFRKVVDFGDNKIIHFCQSQYAMNFVRGNGARNTYFLMDYLGVEHMVSDGGRAERENVILYNPVKGMHFTRRIIRRAGRIFRFVALSGMDSATVHEWCSKAKVYIDFGDHPGKDRFPREAAMAGCIVVTSRCGSAAFHEDVPIPDEYKFCDKTTEIPKILSLISDCLVHFDARRGDFDEYREFIKEDRVRFSEQVKSIFVTGPFCNVALK